MKPISDKAFSEICNQFSLECEDYCSQATYEEPFPVKKVYKLLAADSVGTSERIG